MHKGQFLCTHTFIFWGSLHTRTHPTTTKTGIQGQMIVWVLWAIQIRVSYSTLPLCKSRQGLHTFGPYTLKTTRSQTQAPQHTHYDTTLASSTQTPRWQGRLHTARLSGITTTGAPRLRRRRRAPAATSPRAAGAAGKCRLRAGKAPRKGPWRSSFYVGASESPLLARRSILPPLSGSFRRRA